MKDSENESSVSAVMVSQITMIGEKVDETPLGREIKQIGEKIEHEHELTQLLGVSLRSVLPYAQNELDSLHEAYKRDREEVLKEEIGTADRALQRARQALQHLNDSPLSIESVEDDAFDDSFKIVFEDDE